MTREDIIKSIKQNEVIVIVRGVDDKDLIPLAQALYDGGIRLMEITFSAKGDPSDVEVANNIGRLTNHFGDKMLFGAGTVITPYQVELVKKVGGKFIISPNVDEDVIKKTRELDLISIPGALTPTECASAKKFGADFVKLFPVNAFGADYLKAIKAPLSHIDFLAVGGVGPENMPTYKAAGACGFGIGSTVINKQMIKDGDFKGITELAKKYTALVGK